MIHLSEVLGLAVLSAARAPLGRVEDLAVDSSSGCVARLVARGPAGPWWVPWSQVQALSPEKRKVVLAGDAAPAELPADSLAGESETLSLRREVLDRQIIDIHGRKVVRVNDVVLEPADGRLCLRLVEVGLAGAVRRLLAGLVAPRLVRRLTAGLAQRGIPWDYVGLVDPRSATIRLKVHQNLARLHPADLADIIEDLGRVERQAIVRSLDTETAAQALAETTPSVQAALVEAIQVETAADILEEMPPDEAADILGDLPAERSEAVLGAMQQEDARDLRELLNFSEDSAGGLMTTEYFHATAGWSVGETLEALRRLDLDDGLDEVPVTTPEGQLVGLATLINLLRTPPDQPVTAALRRETPAVEATASFKEVLGWFEKYHRRVLAVTDEYGRLVGVIDAEDVMRRLVAKA